MEVGADGGGALAGDTGDLVGCVPLVIVQVHGGALAVAQAGEGGLQLVVPARGALRGVRAGTVGEACHVIVAEDIIDSGLTLKYLLKNLQSREPASLTVAALMRKDTPAQADIPCRYIGFECPDEFIVGYGLDFAEHYRNLPYIGVLKPEIYQ